MKVDRLSSVYEKGVLEFLEFAERNIFGNNGLFYFSCVNCGNIKKRQRKKYYITFVVLEYVKIIQYGRGTEKWIKIKLRCHKCMKLMKIWMI